MGPQLKAHFVLKEGGVASCALSLSNEKGFSWSASCQEGGKRHLAGVQEWIETYLSKKEPSFCPPLLLPTFPSFTSAILQAICQVPFGHSMTYQELALSAGVPKAVRAAGTACGRNPLPLIIPCHRIKAKGGIGGYALPLEIKRRLLVHEA